MAEMQPLVGKPLDLDQVGKRITDLYGLGNFETIDYSLVEQRKGAGPDTGTGTGVARPAPARPPPPARAAGTSAGTGLGGERGTGTPRRRRGIRSRSAGAAQVLGTQLSCASV